MSKLKNSNYDIQIPDIILEGGDRRRTIMISSVSDPHLHYLIQLLLATWLGAALTSPHLVITKSLHPLPPTPPRGPGDSSRALIPDWMELHVDKSGKQADTVVLGRR